jgi:hypothetical protein
MTKTEGDVIVDAVRSLEARRAQQEEIIRDLRIQVAAGRGEGQRLKREIRRLKGSPTGIAKPEAKWSDLTKQPVFSRHVFTRTEYEYVAEESSAEVCFSGVRDQLHGCKPEKITIWISHNIEAAYRAGNGWKISKVEALGNEEEEIDSLIRHVTVTEHKDGSGLNFTDSAYCVTIHAAFAQHILRGEHGLTPGDMYAWKLLPQ